jgi:hypothetical protein
MPFGSNINNNNNNPGRRHQHRRRGENNNRRTNNSGGNDINNNNGGGGGGDGGGDGDDDDVLSAITVFCRDEWYQLQHVSTFQDVLEQLPRQSTSLTSKDLVNAKLLFRGTVLESQTSAKSASPSTQQQTRLKQAGIREGDTVFVVPENYRFRPHEALAVFLEMMAKDESPNNTTNKKGKSSSPLAKLIEKWQEHVGGDAIRWWLQSLQSSHFLEREQMSQRIRSAVDLGYHRLRMVWERPSFRHALRNNPNLMEPYRKVICHHLPKSIQQELSPTTKQFLQNPQAWRDQVLQLTEGILRLGDLILDGLLDIVLDVVQGAGARGGRGASSSGSNTQDTNTNTNLSSQYAASLTSSSQQSYHDNYEPGMEDPSMANQMLFELSESEED